ncbi:hypothetical protein ACFY5C_38715 [Streptomyces sp. NPDC012935]|uniref:hypothetical protein n=1 Tax=Streptomyces sp. NPDC012935 TaxID=3364857 RepID=UPI003685C469
MELTRYVEELRQKLLAAADVGDDRAREAAERLVTPLSSAVRLVMLEALSAATDEITRELAPGAVEIRLRGLDPHFVVTPPVADSAAESGFDHPRRLPFPPPAPLTPGTVSSDDRTTSRINFRPPEHLKTRIEEAAGRDGLSVNAWLVRAVSAMLEYDERTRGPERPAPRGGGDHYTGWVT